MELIDTEDEWAPYLSVDDALKLDEVRDLLCSGNLEAASRRVRIFELPPIANAP